MKSKKEKNIGKIIAELKQNEKLLVETEAERMKIYEGVKDFTVDAITTDIAIKKMGEKKSEINGIKRRIKNRKKKLNEQS